MEKDLSQVWGLADHGVSGDGGRSGRESVPFGCRTVQVRIESHKDQVGGPEIAEC